MKVARGGVLKLAEEGTKKSDKGRSIVGQGTHGIAGGVLGGG